METRLSQASLEQNISERASKLALIGTWKPATPFAAILLEYLACHR
jgi:hypothetical protein